MFPRFRRSSSARRQNQKSFIRVGLPRPLKPFSDGLGVFLGVMILLGGVSLFFYTLTEKTLTEKTLPSSLTRELRQERDRGGMQLHAIDEQSMLLDREGNWLTNPQPDTLTFFTKTSFRDQFPTAWRIIKQQESGQIHTVQGLFTFVTLNPAQTEPQQSQTVTHAGVYKLVEFVPQYVLETQARSRRNRLFLAALLSLAIAIGLSYRFVQIQHKKQTEYAQIQQSNEFFRRILDALAEPLYVIDINTYEVIIANQAARQLGNPQPYTCYGLSHQRDRPCDSQNDPCPLQIVQQTKAPVVVEHTHVHADGKPNILEVHGYPVCDHNGNLIYLVEYSIDITARRQVENEIRKLSQAVEQSANSIIITDAKGRIEYVNLKCIQTTGYRLDELLGKTPKIFNSGQQSKEYYQTLWKTIKSGHEWRGEFCNRRKDSTLYWEQASIAPLMDQNGKITNFIAVKEDITDRKKTEEALRISQEQLHQKAQDLTQTLKELRRTQAQLIQTEKMSSLMQLVAGIAHEINNPLNFIANNLAYLELYAQDLIHLIQLYQAHYPHPAIAIAEELEAVEFDYVRADLHKLIASMKSGVERISSIVLSLRTFSRIDESELKWVDIHEGLESTLKLLEGCLTDSQTGTRINIQRDYGLLPQVECYAGQLNQVFMNILRNAIDALQSRRAHQHDGATKQIDIQTRLIENDGQYIMIRIQDNGLGIPPDILPRIFDPFFTTKPVGKGTGLGLAVSYEIIKETHHGQLECTSIPGERTEFVITIPRCQSHA